MKPEEAAGLLHAYIDGELDPAASRDLEAEMSANPSLRAAHERLREMSSAIRDKADYHVAPAGFGERFAPPPRTVPPKTQPLVRLRLAAAFAAVAALGFGLALVLMQPSADERVLQDVVAGHVRATLGNRIMDVASSDMHTVKPWLSARLPYSPPVANLSQQGFELAGARIDYAGSRPVAVLAYKRRQHVIDVFIWPGEADGSGRAYARDGFNVEHLSRDGMSFWFVSDLNRNELDDLARLVAGHR